MPHPAQSPAMALVPPAPAAPAHWLDRGRITVYPRIFLAIYLVAGLVWVWLSVDLIDPKGKPLGYDFITFWAASWLALSGHPESAFDIGRILAAEEIAVPANTKLFLWHYPPTFQLIVLPFALLPYLATYAAWIASTLGAYVWVVRRLAPRPETLWLLLAFPGTFVNAFHGQNGFLSAALFGGAVLLLKPRPVLAGVLIGLLSYKPQLGLLIPIALLCGRQWTAFAAAAATTLVFAGVSILVLGWQPWAAFWANMPLVRVLLDNADLPWEKIPSLYVSLRLLGVGATVAYALQAVLALAVAGLVGWVWWLRRPLPLCAAVLTAGAVLAPPYLFDYDLAVLAVPIALLAWDGLQRGWLRGEREILVLAWLTPLLAPAVAERTGMQTATLCLLALFAVAVRRALASDHVFAAAGSIGAQN